MKCILAVTSSHFDFRILCVAAIFWFRLDPNASSIPSEVKRGKATEVYCGLA
jgi:hypothetical protein